MSRPNPNAKAVVDTYLLGNDYTGPRRATRYRLTLECGHVVTSCRRISTVSCGECREASK